MGVWDGLKRIFASATSPAVANLRRPQPRGNLGEPSRFDQEVRHLLSVGGEIRRQPGEWFSDTLRRHLDHERGRASGGFNPAKEFQDANRYNPTSLEWSE